MIKTIALGVVLLFTANTSLWAAAQYNLQEGGIQLRSVSTLSWGPDDILFIGDSLGGTVYAVQMDNLSPKESQPITVAGFDRELSSYLGLPATDFIVNDMLVHERSQTVFFAVTRGLGDQSQALVLSMDNQGRFEAVDLSSVLYSSYEVDSIPDTAKAFIERGQGGQLDELDIAKSQRLQRTFTITDVDYYRGEIFVAGLSNEEFSSTLRRVPFPFQGTSSVTNIEIYHATHGQYETRAPIRTMVIQEFDGVPYLIAAYTCTPVVVIPLDELQDGAKVFGKTVMEIGFGNTPIDLVSYRQGETDMLLLTNTNYSASAMELQDVIAGAQLTERSRESAGVDFVPMPVTGALQMDNLNDGSFLGLMRDPVSSGLNLYTFRSRSPFKLSEFYVEMDFPNFDRDRAAERTVN